MTDREKFEAWAVSEHFAVHRREGRSYVNPATQHAWDGYQAGRKQMAEEAARECDSYGGSLSDECARAIRSLATPTEGKT